MKSRWGILPVLLLVFLLVSEIAWYSPFSAPKAGSVNITGVALVDNTCKIDYQVTASVPLNATVVAVPVKNAPVDLPVYVFFDPDYPTSGIGSDWVLVNRVWEHLAIELNLRGYSGEVKLVNASELEAVFLSKDPAVVVMAYGAFPSNVFSRDTNLVTPWIESGGVMLWFGWEMGYYSVDSSQAGGKLTRLGLDGIMAVGMYNYDYPIFAVSPTWIAGGQGTSVSEALGIRYNQIRAAPVLENVVDSGGLVLGHVGKLRSSVRVSVSDISMGNGSVVTFGFFIGSLDTAGDKNDPTSFYSISRDIAQILCSGILQSSASSEVESENYVLSAGESIAGSVTVPVSSGMSGVVVYGYNDIDSTGLLFFRQYVPFLDKS